ncbi:hypothetical protein CHS0354_030842, partial [Potamilus streckersoni]
MTLLQCPQQFPCDSNQNRLAVVSTPKKPSEKALHKERDTLTQQQDSSSYGENPKMLAKD